MHESKQAFFLYLKDEDSSTVNKLISQNLIKVEPYLNSFTKTFPLNQNLPYVFWSEIHRMYRARQKRFQDMY